MAVEASQPLKISVAASADLSASQYLFMKYDTNGRAAVVTAASDACIGVLQNRPKALGQMAEIVVVGVTKVKAPGSVAIGAYIGTDSAGKAQSVVPIPGTSATYVQATKQSLGQKYESPGQEGAASTNDVYTATVNCLNPVPAT